ETPTLNQAKNNRAAASEIGLFVTEKEMCRRIGVSVQTGRIALERQGFPRKQPLFGNRRYWPAVRHFLDVINGLAERQSYRYSGAIDGPETVPEPRYRG